MTKIKKGHVVHGYVEVHNRNIINRQLGVFCYIQSSDKKDKIKDLLHLISDLNNIPGIEDEKNLSVLIKHLKEKGLLN